ncbi:hypothetical protein ACIBG8_52145 [Nonomuraea sp. NPDC050556]|uniref:hypothetical protein n=1 Tax=Nonomuraea sp. NPDC050556 TaxID=3364369 RepID=UPI00378AC690
MKIIISAVAALLVMCLAPAAQASASASAKIPWGPYSGPGVRASGSLTPSGEDHAVLPTADTVKIVGKVTDLDRSKGNCGWVVFRIGYRKGNNLPSYERYVIDCSYGTAKKFTRTYHDVYQVELKVCSEPKAKKPSLTCYYSGTWKVLYTSPH